MKKKIHGTALMEDQINRGKSGELGDIVIEMSANETHRENRILKRN